ncbi:MAG TPA: gamma-glutamyltransferase, partial [Acidimicrobiales bacterium]|nr:gamma-glutamyltransferase [Acidimicrobiales bacterium]
GRAGAGASADRLRAAGLTAIPRTGDPAAVPVPGCVDGWLALHDRFGRRPLAEVLAPAIWYAAQGFPASPGLAAAVPLVLSVDGADDYRVAGGVRPGTVIRRPGVARALEAIASGGREAFYQGEFGEGLLSVGRSVGGSGEYTADDLATVQAEWVDAISAPAWGHRIWTAPPSSQGYLVPASAWIADGLDLPADPDDPLWAHLLIEAARQAAYDRLDVLYDGADGASLLDPARLAPRRAAIDPARAAVLGVPADAGDTIALCAVDGDRQGITLIQSNAGGWGSMLVVPGVRVFLHNRGQGFSLQPGHPAEYRPGRRPPHTLSPALVTGDGGALRAVVGTMGGDAQPQILLQLLARLLHTGQAPGDILAAGRFALGAPSGSDRVGDGFGTWSAGGQVSVRLEGQVPAGWAPDLAGRGHSVAPDAPFLGSYGHAHLIDVAGDVLSGATDPRPLAGAAAGW